MIRLFGAWTRNLKITEIVVQNPDFQWENTLKKTPTKLRTHFFLGMMRWMIDADFLLPMAFKKQISHPLKTEAATGKQMEKKHVQHFTGPLL